MLALHNVIVTVTLTQLQELTNIYNKLKQKDGCRYLNYFMKQSK